MLTITLCWAALVDVQEQIEQSEAYCLKLLVQECFWSLSELQTIMHKFERLCHKLKEQQFLLSFDEKMEIKDTTGFTNVLRNNLQ